MTTPNPEGGAPPGPPGDLGRTRGWHRPVWLIVLAALGLAVPLVAYGWFVGHFGVNALYADDWSDVGLISRAYGGTLGFAQLWAVHGENRILFPNLIVLLLAYTTRFNVVVEEWISAAMLAAATVLFILAHRRRAPDIPWIAYCPVAILMLSFSQGRNAIWGFQMAWYVVIAALAATLFLLDRPELGRVALAGAIVTGVIGSFSSLQGLLVWPSGLVLLWLCGRTRKVIVSWLVAAVVTTVVYFINFQFPPGNLAYVLSHPVDGVLFYFFAVGDVVGLQAPSGNHPGNGAVIALGILICAIAVWTVVMYCRRRDASEAGRDRCGRHRLRAPVRRGDHREPGHVRTECGPSLRPLRSSDPGGLLPGADGPGGCGTGLRMGAKSHACCPIAPGRGHLRRGGPQHPVGREQRSDLAPDPNRLGRRHGQPGQGPGSAGGERPLSQS